MKRALFAAALLCAATAQAQLPVERSDHNYYEWSAVAPLVITGTSLGEVSRLHEIAVIDSLRGDVRVGDRILIDLRRANKNRDRMVHPDRLRLEEGVQYAILLQPTEREGDGPEGKIVYWLIRGVEGARALPAEGVEAHVAALRRFVEVQDLKSHPLTWHHMKIMLEETNPIMIATALEQFRKFRRAELDLVGLLRPLLAHPRDDIRADAARVLAAIVERHGAERLAEPDVLRSELAGRARRDRAEAVRVAATEAVATFDDAATDEILREIAEADAEQMVRYTAERLLLQRSRDAEN